MDAAAVPGEAAEQPVGADEGDGQAMELDVSSSDEELSSSSDESEESSSDESDEEGGDTGAPAAAVGPASAEPVSAEQRALTEVFVGGLDPDTKEADLEATFSAAGELAEARGRRASPQPPPALSRSRVPDSAHARPRDGRAEGLCLRALQGGGCGEGALAQRRLHRSLSRLRRRQSSSWPE